MALLVFSMALAGCGEGAQADDDDDDDDEQQQSSYEKLCEKVADCKTELTDVAAFVSECAADLKDGDGCIMNCINTETECERILLCIEGGGEVIAEYCDVTEDGDEELETDGDAELEPEIEVAEEVEESEIADGDSGEFDPEDPGITIEFIISYLETMGTAIDLAVGDIHKTLREDLEPEDEFDFPVDSCVLASEYGPIGPKTCVSDEECAEEQVCDPKDKVCTTPLDSLMDVGPIELDGLPGGTAEFLYNAGQSGAYTMDGQGDGQIEEVAFDTTYEVRGDGDLAQGLGAFSGSLTVPAKFVLTSPVITPDPQWQFSTIELNTAEDLVLQWQGGGDSSVVIMFSMTGANDTAYCKMSDDGEFTIENGFIQAVGFTVGADLFSWVNNVIEIKTEAYGEITGEGITVGSIYFLQSYAGVFAKVLAK